MSETPKKIHAHILPAAERQQIAKTVFVEHDRFTEVMDFVARRHKPVEGGAPDYGTISVICGESRAGKSVAVKHYADLHPSIIEAGKVLRPVVYLETPSEATPRALMEAIAVELNFSHSGKMNNSGLEAALLHELTQQGVELLIIDELQEIFDSTRRKAINTTRAFLRKILNRCQLNIVVVGLTSTYTIIAADKQLKRRGQLPRAIVRPYLWGDPTQQKEFRLLCDYIDEGLPFAEKSRLGTEDMGERLYWVSDGLIGCLVDYVYAAACLAINAKTECIEIEHFSEVWEERRPPGMTFNPFTDDMNDAPSKDIDLEEDNAKIRNRKAA